MSSKKALKKEIHEAISNVVEEAYSYQLFNPGKKEKEVNALIDKSVDVLDDLMVKINSAKSLAAGKDTKTHYSRIREDFEKSKVELEKEVNKLGK